MTELPFLIRRGPHRLAAVLHRTGSRHRRLVILAHGFTGLKSETGRLFVMTARALAARGLDVLRFDFMGSGDSSGEFTAMTPCTEIADLHAVINWARHHGYRQIGVLGLSLGGGVSICAVAGRPVGQIGALCTWSSVPSFKFWRRRPNDELLDPQNCSRVSPRFFTDRPVVDIPSAYATIPCPKLQIQGDRDLPGFRKGFEKNMRTALPPKRHVVVPGADHVFSRASDRRKVIRLTANFFVKHLG
ncbi:MAG: alpha/beta fold hydrolase [Opitutaceae bacterium]|nr:alpha/beta fold hydrolase [Opitutaceae bacterium]